MVSWRHQGFLIIFNELYLTKSMAECVLFNIPLQKRCKVTMPVVPLKNLLISLHISGMGFPVITDNCEKQTEHINFSKKNLIILLKSRIFRARVYITLRFLR